MPDPNRRDLLKLLGTTAAAAAAVPVLVAGTAEADETPQEQVKQRYQDSDHVKRFYALLRL